MSEPAGPGRGPGREPESATFEAASVPVRRGRPPVFIAGFLVVLGGIVAIGIGNRGAPGSTTAPVALAASAVPPPAPTTGPSASPSDAPLPSAPGMVDVPLATSGPGDLQLLARRARTSIFVHGDVFVPHVTWVFVSLQDDSGNVAGWASVSVPGGAGPRAGAGPSLRFDVELAVPDAFAGPLWVNANAYDSSGTVVASTHVELATVL